MYMEIKKANIEDLKTVSKFAALKKVSRQFVYQLIDKQELDYTVIDGVIFIVMNNKTKNYKRKK